MNNSQTFPPEHQNGHAAAIRADYPRMKALLAAHPEINQGYFQALAGAISMENSSLKSKSRKFFLLADEFNKTAGKYSVCHKGCAYCCYLPTMIYAHEAEALGQAAGIQPAPLPYRERSVVLADAFKHAGSPCPFLRKDKVCSVYEHRPLICRLHHSLNNAPEDCVVIEKRTEVPIAKIDPDLIEMPYHALVLHHRPKEPWGIIQMFFPNRG